mgnify:FL=1
MNKLTMAAARKNAGLTQEQTAKALGMCRAAYCRLEKNPKAMKLQKVICFLQITNADFNDIDFGSM